MTGPCAKQRVKATLVTPSGERFVGYNDVESPQEVCPRAGMATGQGYELCLSVCRQPSHAEVAAVKLAGGRASGSVIYVEGHYYACEPCASFARKNGVDRIEFGAPPEYFPTPATSENGNDILTPR